MSSNFVFLLRCQFWLWVTRALFQLTHSLSDFFFTALFFLGLTEEVRFKELVFSLDLLVVLFHGFKALHELLNSKTVEVHILSIKVGSVLVHFLL